MIMVEMLWKQVASNPSGGKTRGEGVQEQGNNHPKMIVKWQDYRMERDIFVTRDASSGSTKQREASQC
jgi:hypothetical protein